MIIKKPVGEGTVYSHMNQIRLANREDVEGNKLFMKFLVSALDRVEQGQTARGRFPVFTETLAGVEARSSVPLTAETDPKFKAAVRIVFQHEGSRYVEKDNGEEASKFGVLQGTANRLGFQGDVKNLSKGDAQAIYAKLWDESGAKDLPYSLSLVHFDTYVNSPAAARRLLKKSGGNVEVYLQQRGQRYARLVELKPERFAKYLKGWMNRIRSLRVATTEYAMATAAVGLSVRTDRNPT